MKKKPVLPTASGSAGRMAYIGPARPSTSLAKLKRQAREDAHANTFRPPVEPSTSPRDGSCRRDLREAYGNEYWRIWHQRAFERGEYWLL